jgi:hypothetical protein
MIILAPIIAIASQVLSTWLGRLLAATAASLIALQVYASWHQRIGAARAVRTINEQTEVLDAKARKARTAAPALLSRLLNRCAARSGKWRCPSTTP